MIRALVLLAVAGPVAAADPAPKAVASVKSGDAWVGQRVTLVVELYSPTYFASAAAFDLPTVPGVVITKPDERPTLDSRQVEGHTYTVQRHEFAVYAARAGRIELPAFPVRFAIAGPPDRDVRVTTSSVAFTAKLPPGADGLGTLVTTTDLTLTETWKPLATTAKVGGAFTRTVTVTAKDVPGMVLPPIRPVQDDLLAAYPKTPVVEDRVNRGELTGRREDSATYVCQASGSVTFPALVLTWWDPETKQLRKARLPGRTVEIAAAPVPVEPAPAAVPPTPKRWPYVAAGFLALGMVVGLVYGRRMGGWLSQRRQARAASESAAFVRVCRACRSGDAPGAFRALLAWLDRVSPAAVGSLDGLKAEWADPVLAAELDRLQGRLYGRAGVRDRWDGAELERGLRHFRRHRSGPVVKSDGALGPLNPA